MEFVDAHCHFDFPAFDGHRHSVLERARHDGLTALVIPGVKSATWQRVRETADQFGDVYYCLGLHPWFVSEHQQSDLEELERALSSQRPVKCIALGECGLDRVHGDLEQQYPWFEAQVDIAARTGIPLVIHSVKTHDEVYAILRRRQPSGSVLVHGFSGSYEQAVKLIDLGCFIGIGGVITHPRARKTRSTVARLPLDALVLETDAPDMPPEGVSKGRNSPAYLHGIFDALAGLRREAQEELEQSLLKNVRALYGERFRPLGRG